MVSFLAGLTLLSLSQSTLDRQTFLHGKDVPPAVLGRIKLAQAEAMAKRLLAEAMRTNVSTASKKFGEKPKAIVYEKRSDYILLRYYMAGVAFRRSDATVAMLYQSTSDLGEGVDEGEARRISERLYRVLDSAPTVSTRIVGITNSTYQVHISALERGLRHETGAIFQIGKFGGSVRQMQFTPKPGILIPTTDLCSETEARELSIKRLRTQIPSGQTLKFLKAELSLKIPTLSLDQEYPSDLYVKAKAANKAMAIYTLYFSSDSGSDLKSEDLWFAYVDASSGACIGTAKGK